MIKKIVLVILAAFLIFGGSIAFSLWRGIQEIRNLTIGELELSGIADGTYAGSYESGLIKVRLDVHVAEGNITAIEILEHDNGQGTPAEAITENVVAEQSLQVDAISGATLSSKVILKAVEAALTGVNR